MNLQQKDNYCIDAVKFKGYLKSSYSGYTVINLISLKGYTNSVAHLPFRYSML